MLLPIVSFFFISLLYLGQETMKAYQQQKRRRARVENRSSDLFSRARDVESLRRRVHLGFVFRFFKEALLPTLSVVVVTLFTYIISSAISPLSCVRHQNQFLMYRNPSQDCFSDDWFNHLPMVVFFILAYGICFPIGIAIILAKHFRTERNEESLRIFGSLVKSYKTQFFYWELLAMLKKTMFVLSTEFINSTQGFFVRSSTSILAVGLFGGIEALWQPYISENSNLLSST
jgi:hypothetical protein